MACDIAWYVENIRLAIKGIDILSLTKRDVPTSQIEKKIRPKISKNGYKYDRKVSIQVV
jgi:hypothetical protein